MQSTEEVLPTAVTPGPPWMVLEELLPVGDRLWELQKAAVWECGWNWGCGLVLDSLCPLFVGDLEGVCGSTHC